MQIQKLCALPFQAQVINKKMADMQPVYEYKQYSLPSGAYRDYNITFGAQINRTPANFYAFNQKNLPDMMKAYLNRDYEDRQHMPPAQMMKEVYGDLALPQITSLDFIPRIFPDEPLFANLTDIPNRKARKGLVSQVETMKDEFKDIPLFKDGSSNLGVYLLRKIYIEGKQCKEIKEDFNKDLSKEYEGLITEPVEYSTFSAYGIKFPKVPFWNSFVVTRDDWNYVYKPRKIEGSALSTSEKREITLADIISGKVPPEVKPPKFKIEKRTVERMTDAVLNGHGSSNVTEKLLKRKGLQDNEEISFVSRYLGQIMSVALEKIHASEEMRDFFEHYDDLTKSQQKKLESYWHNNPKMRQLQSLAISDTIKLFFEAYGSDGNNEEFQGLLTYADSIKPARELKDMLHNKRQAEYDQMFAELDAAVAEQTPIQAEENIIDSTLNKMSDEELQALMELEAKKQGAKLFKFTSPEGRPYVYVCNVDEVFETNLREDMILLPTAFVNRYYKFIQNSPLATEAYKEAVALRPKVEDFAKDQLLSLSELRGISTEINKTYNIKYPQGVTACDQALAELIFEKMPSNSRYTPMLDRETSYLIGVAEDSLGISKWSDSDMAKLNKLYSEYSTPIQSKQDLSGINRVLVDYISNFNENSSSDSDPFFSDLIKLLGTNINRNQKYRNMLEKVIRQTKFIENYGGTSKLLLKPGVSSRLRDERCNIMVKDLIQRYVEDLIPILTLSTINIQKCISDAGIRDSLILRAVMANNSLLS